MWPDGSRESTRDGINHRTSSRPGQGTRADGRHLSDENHRSRSRSPERPREPHNHDPPCYSGRGRDQSYHVRERSSGGYDQPRGRAWPSHQGQSSPRHRPPRSDDRRGESERASEGGWPSPSTGGGWGSAAPSGWQQQQRSGGQSSPPPSSRPRAGRSGGDHQFGRSTRDSRADGVGRRGSIGIVKPRWP